MEGLHPPRAKIFLDFHVYSILPYLLLFALICLDLTVFLLLCQDERNVDGQYLPLAWPEAGGEHVVGSTNVHKDPKIVLEGVGIVTPRGDAITSNLSLTVAKNRAVMVTGRNATGKSSFVRAVSDAPLFPPLFPPLFSLYFSPSISDSAPFYSAFTHFPPSILRSQGCGRPPQGPLGFRAQLVRTVQG